MLVVWAPTLTTVYPVSSPETAPHTLSAASYVAPDAEETTRWFKEEVQPHEQALRSYLRKQFPSVDTDDVVQESYLRLFKVRTKRSVASAKNYVFAIARNTARAVFRRAKYVSDIPVSELPDWHVLDDVQDAAAITNQRLQFSLAEQAIDQLPPRCREIVRLAAFEQLPPAEIARRLGVTESTVYVQLARGLKKSARYLREREEVP